MTRFNSEQVKRFGELIRRSGTIIITCHICPDGDALGSSLGLLNLIHEINPAATAVVVTPDEPTRNLAFLPRFSDIQPFSRYHKRLSKLIEQADLIVCLDFNALMRIDRLAPSISESSAVKILIDHHLEPEPFADIVFSFPEKCATSMLLYELIEEAGLDGAITPVVADCLLAGMMTDTGDFTYNVADPDIYSVIGKLISKGADKARLTRLLFDTVTEESMRIQGFALSRRMQVFKEMHAALIVLSQEDLNQYGYSKGDTEGLVNKPLAIPGVLYSCFLRQETDYVKVSMRSLGDLPVNEICQRYYNGGGHLNAAGGEFYDSMEQSILTFKNSLPVIKKEFIDDNKVLESILKDELH